MVFKKYQPKPNKHQGFIQVTLCHVLILQEALLNEMEIYLVQILHETVFF